MQTFMSRTFKALVMCSSLPLMRQSLKVSLSTLNIVAERFVAKITVVPFPHDVTVAGKALNMILPRTHSTADCD